MVIPISVFIRNVLVLCATACAPATLIASNAVILCDTSQTLWMADGGRFDHGLTETNPLLGEKPADATILAAGVFSVIANTAVYYAFPRWRPYVNAGVLVVEGANVLTQPSDDSRPYSERHHGCDLRRKL